MAQYSARYKNPLTGRTTIITRPAGDHRAAQYELPRWIYPDSTPLRRIGSIKLEKVKT